MATTKLRISEIRYETEAIRSFKLKPLEAFDFSELEPGAHVELSLPNGLIRNYSITNGPDETESLDISVARDAQSSGGSTYMVDELRVGEVLNVKFKQNTFPLCEGNHPSVFFAGGIGITPILSMIKNLDRADGEWRLIYAVRSRDAAAFLSEIEKLDAGRGRVHVHIDDEAGSFLSLSEQIDLLPKTSHLYCCGPTGMIGAFEEATSSWSEDQIHIERFAGDQPEGAENEFLVRLNRSGKEFLIPPGKTIMEVLKDNGVRVAYSCQSGVCGTCETRVLEGTPDHKDNVLSDREKESGKMMMICCSLSKGERLVLDL